MTTNYDECIEACKQCADACDYCATACLEEDNVSKMAKCIATDIDCAALCRTAVGFMARGSALAPAVCKACAEVCQKCADECSKHDHNHCQECAEACRSCAESCRAMPA